MQMTLTISGETGAEILLGLQKAVEAFGIPAPTSEPKPATKAESKKEEKSAQKVEQKADKKAEPKKETVKPASGVTLEAVAGKIAEICENKTHGGKDKAREILAKFGAKKGGELKPEQYADFIKAADAVLNPTEDASDDEGLM